MNSRLIKFTRYIVCILLTSGCGSTVIDFKLSLNAQKNGASASNKDKVYRDTEKASQNYAFFPIVYENENIKIRFNADNLYFWIFFDNNTNAELVALWNKAKLYSDENQDGIPLTARLMRSSLEGTHSGYRDYFEFRALIINPKEKASLRIRPDYRYVFKRNLLFDASVKDKPVYLAERFKDKELSIYLPMIENGVETAYLFTLKVLDAKAHTSYY